MPQATIARVFEFISQNPGYRATMGVVVSRSAKETVMCWGAVKGGQQHVPELAHYRHQWPDAEWVPLSQRQASLFEEAWEASVQKSY